jgi:adenylate kinase family enzyme
VTTVECADAHREDDLVRLLAVRQSEMFDRDVSDAHAARGNELSGSVPRLRNRRDGPIDRQDVTAREPRCDRASRRTRPAPDLEDARVRAQRERLHDGRQPGRQRCRHRFDGTRRCHSPCVIVPPPEVGNRVLVVGSGGAGKTVVARALAARTGLPLIHLDAHYWRPNWEPTPVDAWRARVRELITRSQWVMDGNYSSTLDLRLPAADTIVFLDLPRRVTLRRVLARWLRWHGRVRPEMPQGCPERMSLEFARWLWRFPREGRRRLLDAITVAGVEDRVIRLTSRRAVAAWLTTQ